MNKIVITWLSAATIVVAEARGQGAFQNLNFEAARNLPAPGVSVATTNGLPGWSAFSGTSQLTTIPYNLASAAPKVGLYGPPAIGGDFDVLLHDGGSISQIGVVPADAVSLYFKRSGSSLSPLIVSLGGQSLPYTALFSVSSYTLYGVDISTFAGQTASLAFLALSGSLHFIDDIEFSPQVIPEPSSLALLVGGGLLLAARRICVRKP